MRATIEETHTLEMRRVIKGEWRDWHTVAAGMFQDAIDAANNERFIPAIRLANEAQIANYGSMDGVEFRVRSVRTTITTLWGCPTIPAKGTA